MQYRDLIEFRVACETAGVTTPAPIVRGIELIDLAHAAAVSQPPALLDLADDEVAGQVFDLSVREHSSTDKWNFASAKGLGPGSQVFESRLCDEVQAATIPLLDDLVIALRPKFDALTAPIVVAAQQYGFTYATTSDQVIDLADEGASAAWREARAAWKTVTPIVRFRMRVSDLFGVSPTLEELARNFYTPNPRIELDYSVCFAAGSAWSYDHALYLGQKPGQLDWFALAAGGLHLNTPSEVRELIAARR